MKRKTTKRIIVHHSASPRNTTTTLMVRNWHKEKGFTDILGYSGYHYFILWDGTVVTDRPEEECGCHTKDANNDSIGICVMGNFNKELPSEKQTNSLTELLIKLVKKYNLKYWNVYGHRDIKWLFVFSSTSTNCPGNNLYCKLREIRRRIFWAITSSNKEVNHGG